MSIKGKVPFVEYVASKLSNEELASFKTELDSAPSLAEITYADLTEDLIGSVSFKFTDTDYKNGIIVKNDDVCVLFVFYDAQTISIYDIDLVNHTYKEIKEYCTIDELRRVTTVTGASEWEQTIKEYVVQNDNTTEVGGNMEVDGDLKTNTSLTVPSKESILDPDGNPISFGGDDIIFLRTPYGEQTASTYEEVVNAVNSGKICILIINITGYHEIAFFNSRTTSGSTVYYSFIGLDFNNGIRQYTIDSNNRSWGQTDWEKIKISQIYKHNATLTDSSSNSWKISFRFSQSYTTTTGGDLQWNCPGLNVYCTTLGKVGIITDYNQTTKVLTYLNTTNGTSETFTVSNISDQVTSI